MEAPVCLIENTKDGKLVPRSDALEILISLKQPLVIVSMVGKYGTGKSFLLNILAERNGFLVGETAQAHTKGIWMWCVPHPRKQHHCLLLLDTEGLGNVESDIEEIDTWICALALLFSNVLVFNTMDVIDHTALMKLHNAMKLVAAIKERLEASGTCEDWLRSVPNLVWAMRDFALDLEINGAKVTSDQYFEYTLQRREGSKVKTQFNQATESLRRSFPNRKCFAFAFHSTNRNQRCRGKLDEEFINDCQTFCNYIYGVDPINPSSASNKASGEIFATFVKDCLGLLISCRNTSLPPHSADRNVEVTVPPRKMPRSNNSNSNVESFPNGITEPFPNSYDMLTWENKAAYNESSNPIQQEKMEVMEVACSESAAKRILHHSQGYVSEQTAEDEELTEKHQNLLKSLFKPMDEKLKAGDYAVTEGYRRYVEERAELEERYRCESGNTMKANEVLEKYLKEKVTESELVRMMDKLTADKARELTALTGQLDLIEQERRTLCLKLEEKEQIIKQLKDQLRYHEGK